MDGLSVHLPPVIPDPFYDMSTHGNGYHSYQTPQNNTWSNRSDIRGYQPQNTEFDPQLRFTGASSTRHTCPSDPPVANGTTEAATTGDCFIQVTVGAEWSGDDVKEDRKTDQSSPRQSQVAVTLNWLSENYERSEGVCLPRCVLYQHYLDFCKKMKFTPAGAATFGKIIRQRFPKLTTRRLGTRGQSKYHYYGIGIKETSIYYHSVYSGKGLTRFSGIKLKTEGSSRKYSLSSKTGTLLPEFPNADNLILPEGTDLEKMRTFIIMYRTHCQRILDTIISANFEEVHNFLVHFWQGMPEHLLELLHCEILTDVIALCDSILYKVLVDVLIPSTIQELPHTLYSEIRLFAKRLPHWLETAMETVPEEIQTRKLEVAKGFLQSLKRQSSFVQLAQTTRSVLNSQETLSRIGQDISGVDFMDICSQTGFMDPSANPKVFSRLMEFYDEFRELLNKQSPIEAYTEWIDDVVDKCVIKPGDGSPEMMREKAAEFLLQWGAFGGLLMRELTLKNASSFASIHLIHLMLDEYAFLVIETQNEQDTEMVLQKNLQKHMKCAEEIQTKAIVRNSTAKPISSPKSKKRKTTDDFDSDTKGSLSEVNSTPECNYVNGTAFTRPAPTTKESRSSNHLPHSETPRAPQNPLSVPQLKSYQTYNNTTYDRPTYLPQFGIGTYPDYVGSNPSFGAGRLSNYSESYPQTFPASPFSTNISSVGSNYWTDGRSHHSFTDPYQSYNKLTTPYDPLNKNSFLRNSSYQDSFNRPAFDTSRTFYRSTHDTMQVGTTFQVGAFGGNFMDIAPSAGQYCYQDDLFPPTMASGFGKPYISGPFR